MDDRADSVNAASNASCRASRRPVACRVADSTPAGRDRLPGDPRTRVAGMVLDRAPAEREQHRLPTDVAVRRGWLVLKALPHVVPETSFRESILGHADRGAEPPRKPAAARADSSDGLLIAAAAVGLGDLVLRAASSRGGLGLARARRPRLRPGSRASGRADALRRQAGLA